MYDAGYMVQGIERRWDIVRRGGRREEGGRKEGGDTFIDHSLELNNT